MAVFSVTEAMVSWLSSMGYRAATRPPADGAGTFATVERVGGGVASLVDRASVAVQAWADTEAAAEAAANDIRNRALTTLPPPGVHSARVESGPYPFFDESTRKPRYQLVLDVACQVEI